MSLLAPQRLWSRHEVLSKPCPVPRDAGVYAWYFKEIPPGVPTDGCARAGELTLLYVGIAPRAPSQIAKPVSSQRLCHRVRYHYRGNAEGSTLRLTLGCLLAAQLGIQLRRVGSGARMTFGVGEAALSNWMQDNAYVVWHAHAEPWVLEERLIGEVSLPLNLAMNKSHAFHLTLSQLRRAAKDAARALPLVVG